MVHSSVFYAAALRNLIPSPWGNLWSSVLRLHVTVFLAGTIIIFVRWLLTPEDDEYDEDYDDEMDGGE
jgi:hypothetical protein